MFALLRGITSKRDGDFYALNCFHSYSLKDKLKKHYNACKNHDYCYVEMPKENNQILKCNHGEKSMKVPFIIYADLQSLLENMSTCHNNPEKSTIKINEHTFSGYSLFTDSSFYLTKNKLDCYGGKDCMEKFCDDLKEYATKIINYEKTKMIPLTDEENWSYKKKKDLVLMMIIKSKVRDHCHYTRKYRGAAHSVCSLRYETPK